MPPMREAPLSTPSPPSLICLLPSERERERERGEWGKRKPKTKNEDDREIKETNKEIVFDFQGTVNEDRVRSDSKIFVLGEGKGDG